MIILYIYCGLMIVFTCIMVDDYFKRKKLSNKVKVGDNPRLFTENEVTFDRVEVMEIYENEKRKRIAKCKHEDGTIIEYSCLVLIY